MTDVGNPSRDYKKFERVLPYFVKWKDATVSMSFISREAKVSKGLVYKHRDRLREILQSDSE